ncbi:MAG TPA: archaemetzincin [Pirellulales bacterium]|jgi:archaemetzincin|nr:archaemetzincin [Pirellulales bacterium]
MNAALLAMLGVAMAVSLAWNGTAAPPVGGTAPATGNIATIRDTIEKVKPLFKVKAAPQPGDWLEKQHEPGQTFEQYIRSNPNRPTAARTTIYVQPIGAFGEKEKKLLDATVDLLGRIYNLPVKTLDPIALDAIPAKARRINSATHKEQLLTEYILGELLPPRRPANAVALLALTTSDLWPGQGWNYVFGQASLTERVGVWSSARYGDPNAGDEAYRRCLMRMCKVATHETGHMFGIEHCTAYECGMNGSNSLAETDRSPLAFCPECSAKIWWACNAIPEKWYGSLAIFAEQHAMKDEAALWRKCQRAMKK